MVDCNTSGTGWRCRALGELGEAEEVEDRSAGVDRGTDVADRSGQAEYLPDSVATHSLAASEVDVSGNSAAVNPFDRAGKPYMEKQSLGSA